MYVKYVCVGIVFTCSTLHLFPYPVPAGDQGSVQHLTLDGVPVDVLANMITLFISVKELKCHDIYLLQVYSVCTWAVWIGILLPITIWQCFDNRHQTMMQQIAVICFWRFKANFRQRTFDKLGAKLTLATFRGTSRQLGLSGLFLCSLRCHLTTRLPFVVFSR